jgi:hypothetical protein
MNPAGPGFAMLLTASPEERAGIAPAAAFGSPRPLAPEAGCDAELDSQWEPGAAPRNRADGTAERGAPDRSDLRCDLL